MKIKYNFSKKDYILTQILMSLTSPGFILIFGTTSLYISYIKLTEKYPYITLSMIPEGILFSSLYYLLIVTFIMLLSILFIVFNKNLKKGILGEHTIELIEEWFIETTSFNEAKYSYSSVSKPKSIFNYILIKINGSQYLFIPKKHFKSKDEIDKFKEIILNKIN